MQAEQNPADLQTSSAAAEPILRTSPVTAEPKIPQPVARRPLHEEVADQLRELIIEGVLAPGSRLNERVLCEHLKVSRTPLREAFKLLAGERLLGLPR